MRHRSLYATPVCALALFAIPGAPAINQDGPQRIHLAASTSDGTGRGRTELTITRERGGFRVRGTVEPDPESTRCVELRAVEPRAGLTLGGNRLRRACSRGLKHLVDRWTRHEAVVLAVPVPNAPGYESRYVRLTG